MYIVVYILYTCIIVVVVLLYFRKYENNMKVFSYEIKFKSYSTCTVGLRTKYKSMYESIVL